MKINPSTNTSPTPALLPSLHIHSGLCSGQVLQRLGTRGANATLSGLCNISGHISASLQDSRGRPVKWQGKSTGTARAGSFTARLTNLPVGGPYRLLLSCGAASTEIRDFYVGDVWLLAGQSNMQGTGVLAGKSSTDPRVRAFSMRREWRLAEDPLHIVAESPDSCHHGKAQCSPEEGEQLRRKAIRGTGVGVFFGLEMLRRTSVPQGLICTAHGGTRMDLWDPARKKRGGASLYASMIASVRATGQPVAGMLWYQGESDAHRDLAVHYTRRMQKLVAATRRDLAQPRLPWAIVQIAKVYNAQRSAFWWNAIREQQRLLPRSIPRLEVATAIDLPYDDPGHVSAAGFPRLALRLADTVDHLLHGSRKALPPPHLKKVRLIHQPGTTFPNRIEVDFLNIRGALRSPGEAQGFSLSTPDGARHNIIFRTLLDGSRATILLGGIPPIGASLHYGDGTSPYCNITDGRDFAIPAFGPVELSTPQAFLPFIPTWKVSDLFQSDKSLAGIDIEDFKGKKFTTRTYDLGFANEYSRWQERPGIALFSATITLPEPMKLQALAGYDGPFRLWIDGSPFFDDLAGTNPCRPDKTGKAISLEKGTHRLHVAMDTNNGHAWGFYLRFRRTDVPLKQIRENSFTLPSYGV